jgi:hypothetical protein
LERPEELYVSEVEGPVEVVDLFHEGHAFCIYVAIGISRGPVRVDVGKEDFQGGLDAISFFQNS